MECRYIYSWNSATIMQHYRYWPNHTSPGSSHNMQLWKALGSYIEARDNFLKFYNFETYLKIPRFARLTITKNCIQQLQPHRVFSTWLCMQRQDKELGTQMWMSTQSWYCHDLSKTIQKSKKISKKIQKISKKNQENFKKSENLNHTKIGNFREF